MINYQLHVHSVFSDGRAAPEEYVKKALSLGYRALGFTEHSPLPFPSAFSLKMEQSDTYVRETSRLKNLYFEKIKLFRGLEFDFIPGFSDNFAFWRQELQLDYAIGSVHLVKSETDDRLWFIDGPDRKKYDDGLQKLFGKDIRKAVRTYFYQVNRMIESQPFEIVGHVDKIKMHNAGRYFQEDEKWYQNLVQETLHLVREKERIIEINTRGKYKKRSQTFFPDGETLQLVRKLQIPVLISSDAHHPDELDLLVDEAKKRLLETGIRSVVFPDGRKWKEVPLV